jgi:hypothetical protein
MKDGKMTNAVIEKTMLGFEDHGLLTAFLFVRFDGCSHQGFGGYGLGDMSANYCGLFVKRVLKVVGVTEWGSLVGRNIRVRHDRGMIVAIGHIIDDVWFEPRVEFEALNNGGVA